MALFSFMEITMKITFEQLNKGIIQYFDTMLAPKATGITKFFIYFYIPSIPKLVQTYYDHLYSQGLLVDFVDEHGNIELEILYARASEAMSKCLKVQIPKINYWADQSDIDELYSILKGV